MASYFISSIFTLATDVTSSAIHNTIAYIESIQVFGYTVKDLPLVPRLLKACNVLTMYDKMEMEINTLKEENGKLHVSIDELKNLNNSLRTEIEDFRKLKENLAKFAKEQNEDFHKVLENINDNYERINNLLFENERVLMMKVAQDVEFMDDKEGMSKREYQRFVDRIPMRLQSKYDLLINEPEYKYLTTKFDDDDQATVSPKTIQKLINDLCKNDDNFKP